MTNSGIWIPMMAPVLPRISLHRLNLLTLSADPFVPTLFVRGLIVGIPIPSSPSLPTNTFSRSVILHPRDLVTCLQALLMQSHREGPEYLSVTRMDKSRSWSILLNVSLWNTWVAPVWSPCYGVMVDAIRASSGESDYICSHGLRIGSVRDHVIAIPNYCWIYAQEANNIWLF